MFFNTSYESVTPLDRLHFISEAVQRVERETGFSLSHSLRPQTLETFEAASARVLETTSIIAEEIELDSTFFERPAHTIMLLAIADAWSMTNPVSAPSTDQSSQRDALVDAALMLTGSASGVVRGMESHDSLASARYAGNIADPRDQAYINFLDSINDPVRAAHVESLLKQPGEGSFLAEQRRALGLSTREERPYTVSVLCAVDSRNEFIDAGRFEQPDLPTSDGGKLSRRDRKRQDAALNQEAIIISYTKPYLSAMRSYQEHFAADFGPLPIAAALTRLDGRQTLYIRANDADTIINTYSKTYSKKQTAVSSETLIPSLAVLKHEYLHTQKSLTLGAHGTIGHIFEERKAELLSGDHNGYKAIKDLFEYVSQVSGLDLLNSLRTSFQRPDALSTLLADITPVLGFSDMLRLMTAMPPEYEPSSRQAEQYVLRGEQAYVIGSAAILATRQQQVAHAMGASIIKK